MNIISEYSKAVLVVMLSTVATDTCSNTGYYNQLSHVITHYTDDELASTV